MLGYRVTQINPKHNGYQIVCESPDHGASTVIETERIISTIPAPELVKCLMNVPDEIHHANSRLQYLGLNVGYDYTGKSDGIFAGYSASPQTVAHRVCNYGFFGGKVRTFETTIPKTDLAQYPYAYPVYTHNRARDIKIILDYAKSLGIDCVGRMATMEYLNMDAVIKQVKEYVKCQT
jgi:protoporphyrinogen oxidase